METVTITALGDVPGLLPLFAAECAKDTALQAQVDVCPYRTNVATETMADKDGETVTEETALCELVAKTSARSYGCARSVCLLCAAHGKPDAANPFVRHRCGRWAYLYAVRSLDPTATFPTTIADIDAALAYIKVDRDTGTALKLANTIIFSRPECLLDTDGALDGDKVVGILDRAGLAQLALKQRRETP